VYRHLGTQYERLEPDLAGRCAIEELDLQVGIWDGWLRYWYQGKLLPVTDELAKQIEQLARQLDEQTREHARELGEQARQHARELDQRDRQIDQQARQHARELDQRDRQLDEQSRQWGEAVQTLRGAVTERARRHGRDDILQQLPAVSDIGQLSRWLAELA
jgi:chromosome segregation ATPase